MDAIKGFPQSEKRRTRSCRRISPCGKRGELVKAVMQGFHVDPAKPVSLCWSEKKPFLPSDWSQGKGTKERGSQKRKKETQINNNPKGRRKLRGKTLSEAKKKERRSKTEVGKKGVGERGNKLGVDHGKKRVCVAEKSFESKNTSSEGKKRRRGPAEGRCRGPPGVERRRMKVTDPNRWALTRGKEREIEKKS